MSEEVLLKEMGKRISTRRKQLGITQEQLAEKINVSIQMISNLEQGKKAVRPANLVNVCTALDISSDYILMGTKNEIENNKLVKKINSLDEKQKGLIELTVNYLIEELQ